MPRQHDSEFQNGMRDRGGWALRRLYIMAGSTITSSRILTDVLAEVPVAREHKLVYSTERLESEGPG
jgi:hypothetical protein